MTKSVQDFYNDYGWNYFFQQQHSLHEGGAYTVARVIGEERGLYRIQTSMTEILWASVSGAFQYHAEKRAHFPAVGDWVLIEVPEGHGRGVIHKVFDRKSVIRRKQVGSSWDDQIIAANIDLIFITTSLNQDFNRNRIERYLTLAWDSGARPILLLTKSDLFTGDMDEFMENLKNDFPHVEMHSVSQMTFAAVDFFKTLLCPGSTSVFVGSSGVGKSTLVNHLIGQTEMTTQEIRENDGKGRHTTTSRFLFQSIYGGTVIDTPGMREIQFVDQVEGMSQQFGEIEQLFLHCKFRDCTHELEPGCAIQQALQINALDVKRWEHYQKVAKEISFHLRKQNKSLQQQEKAIWKQRTKEMKKRVRFKREFGD